MLSEALALGRSLHDTSSVARTLTDLGRRAIILGALDDATRLLDEASAVWQEVGDSWGIAFTRLYLGTIALWQGQLERAASLLEEAVSGLRLVGDVRLTAVALSWLAIATGELGDTPHAVRFFHESLDVGNQLQVSRLLCGCAERVAMLFRDRVDAELLARLLGAVSALRRARDLPRGLLRSRVEQLEATLQDRLGPERFAAARAAGRALSFDQTVTLVREVLDLMDHPEV